MKRFQTLSAIVLLLASSQAVAFPEIPFCPLGGPPGWFNRIFDDNDRSYPPPWYYRRYYYAPRVQHPRLPMLYQPSSSRQSNRTSPCGGN